MKRMEIHYLSKLKGKKEILVMETGLIFKSEATMFGKILWSVPTKGPHQGSHILWLT